MTCKKSYWCQWYHKWRDRDTYSVPITDNCNPITKVDTSCWVSFIRVLSIRTLNNMILGIGDTSCWVSSIKVYQYEQYDHGNYTYSRENLLQGGRGNVNKYSSIVWIELACHTDCQKIFSHHHHHHLHHKCEKLLEKIFFINSDPFLYSFVIANMEHVRVYKIILQIYNFSMIWMMNLIDCFLI